MCDLSPCGKGNSRLLGRLSSEKIQRYNNSPPYVTARWLPQQIPPLNFLGYKSIHRSVSINKTFKILICKLQWCTWQFLWQNHIYISIIISISKNHSISFYTSHIIKQNQKKKKKRNKLKILFSALPRMKLAKNSFFFFIISAILWRFVVFLYCFVLFCFAFENNIYWPVKIMACPCKARVPGQIWPKPICKNCFLMAKKCIAYCTY